MTKIKNMLKKGFTLTELAIVIAVIAILIAVLVPTFISLIDSANESKDTQMIYNVNQALSIESATTDIKTPSQALDVAAEAGYNIDKLTPTSDSEIYYDQANVRFVIKFSDGSYYPSSAAEDFDENAPTTWAFVDEATYTSLNSTANTGSVSYSLAKTTVKSAAETTASGATIHTCSYIAKGDWSTSTLSYTGMGGIDTTRATGITKVEYTIQSTTSTTYTVNPVYSVSKEVKYVPITIASSYADPITVTKYCVAEETMSTVEPASSVNCTVNVDSVDGYKESISWDSTAITVTVTENGKDITTEAYAGELSIVKSAVETYIEALSNSSDATTLVLQMGTEKYPYLVEDKLQTTIETYATDEGKTYYFMLTEDVVATATSRGRRYTTIKSNIIVNGNSKTISANAEADTPTCVYLTSNGTYQFTLYNANILGYIEQEKAVLDLKDFNVTIEDCTMTETGTSCSDSCAITITGAKDINITNCTFTNSRLNIGWGNSDTENVAELSCTIEGTEFSYYISNYETSSDTAMGLINIKASTAYSGQYSVSVKIFDVTVQGRMQNVFVDENTVSNGSKATKLSYEVDTLNVTVSSYNGSDSTAFDVTLKSILGISDSDGVSVTETNCTYQVDGTKYSSYKDYTISE